jgi:hypothetical protein
LVDVKLRHICHFCTCLALKLARSATITKIGYHKKVKLDANFKTDEKGAKKFIRTNY